ncbi:MAG: hypothetical protein ACR2J7_08760 [Luteimonas sp.]
MPAALGLAGWLILHFILALLGAWWVRGYARRRKLLDHPGERRSHQVPTPRGGGLSIVIAMLVALSVLACLYPGVRGLLVADALGLVMVAGVGWMDDHRPLPAKVRLVVHLAAGSVLASALWSAGHGIVPAILALFMVPVLVNVWNFMDGIDGLATSQAAIVAVAYGLTARDAAASALALALAAACCGFLPFNFPKARIFLGDVGSGSLGFLLAALLLWLLVAPGADIGTLALLVLPVSAFLIDASLTLSRRMMRGEQWWTPHVQHAYQGLASRLGRHWPVTAAYAAWTLVGAGLLWAAITQEFFVKLTASVAWLTLGSLIWFVVQARARGEASAKEV